MTKFLGRYSEHLYALLRIVAGWCFFLHGTAKLFGWPGDRPPVEDLLSRAGIAGIIELVGGLLILLGLFASIAAFIASGEMACTGVPLLRVNAARKCSMSAGISSLRSRSGGTVR